MFAAFRIVFYPNGTHALLGLTRVVMDAEGGEAVFEDCSTLNMDYKSKDFSLLTYEDPGTLMSLLEDTTEDDPTSIRWTVTEVVPTSLPTLPNEE